MIDCFCGYKSRGKLWKKDAVLIAFLSNVFTQIKQIHFLFVERKKDEPTKCCDNECRKIQKRLS